MLIAVHNPANPHLVPMREDCHGLELRWVQRVDGEPAGHHVLRAMAVGADDLIRRVALPRWSATTVTWPAPLRWSATVHPRVLRATDACADCLGVTDTAAALVICEQGRTASGAVVVEHELIALARYTDEALRLPRPVAAAAA